MRDLERGPWSATVYLKRHVHRVRAARVNRDFDAGNGYRIRIIKILLKSFFT